MHRRYRCCVVFVFQGEDGIRDLVRSRGLGDVYKRQAVGTKRWLRAKRARNGNSHQPNSIEQIAHSREELSLIHI